MCQRCDYPELLRRKGLDPTPNRLRVLEAIGGHEGPVRAPDLHRLLVRTRPINRVTVYRILDLLVRKGIAERISGGGRSYFYGIAPNENHRPHPHFYCRRCGGIECLSPGSLTIDSQPLARTFPGRIETVAVRVEGVCKRCTRFGGKVVG